MTLRSTGSVGGPAGAWALPVLLFAAGTLYCLQYGRIGYQPLDSPAVFDGGWRVLGGQVPFRDFTLPSAIVPVLLQGLVFAAFGVSWFTYCLHAAVFNGLFCVLVFGLLRAGGAPRWLAFVYGLGSAAVFYTPFGVPFPDQHAWFFTTLAVLAAAAAARRPAGRGRDALVASLPAIAALAYLSKQIPSVFGVVLAGAVLAAGLRGDATAVRRALAALAVGTLGTLAAIGSAAALAGVDPALVRFYFFELPADVGAERVARLVSGKFLATLRHVEERWPLYVPAGVVLLSLPAFLLGWAATRPAPGRGPGRAALRAALVANRWLLALAWGLLATSLLFVRLTNNQRENGFPVLFAALGLVHVAVRGLLAAGANGPAASRPRRRLALGADAALLAVLLASAWQYDRTVNATRSVHDIGPRAPGRGDLPVTDLPMLSFLVWRVPPKYAGTPSDLTAVAGFFASHEGNFFLVGHSSLLYALTGRPSVNPVLWNHRGQTFPFPESPWFAAFEARVASALERHRVRYLVLEEGWGESPRNRVRLDTSPALARAVAAGGCVRQRSGPFTIVELAGDPRGGCERYAP